MVWDEGYIAIDWGTTNRRVYAVDRHRHCHDSFEDACGILSIEPNGFDAEIEKIRRRMGDKPMMLAGMIGSDRGWRPAPYSACPAGPAEITAAITWIEPGRLGIVPGVSQTRPHADVMRGEEVQVFGAIAAGFVPPDGLICHPGTHSKWIEMATGRIARFQTTMTGEVFGLLSQHSILAPQLGGPVIVDDAFRDGVTEALAGDNPLSAMFAIRAERLLGETDPRGAGYASGLLIGADVRAALAVARPGPVFIVGRPELCALYREAIEMAQREAQEFDGAAAFLAGIDVLVEQLA